MRARARARARPTASSVANPGAPVRHATPLCRACVANHLAPAWPIISRRGGDGAPPPGPWQVIICNVMTSGAGITRQVGIAKRLNRQLTLFARESAAEAERKKDGTDPVRLVKLNNPRSERNDGRASDGLHLNARGYRSFASALYEPLGPLMVSVEWKTWKSKLAAGLTVGTGKPGGVSVMSVPVVEKGKSKESKKVD